jgi:hypothetical protein
VANSKISLHPPGQLTVRKLSLPSVIYTSHFTWFILEDSIFFRKRIYGSIVHFFHLQPAGAFFRPLQEVRLSMIMFWRKLVTVLLTNLVNCDMKLENWLIILSNLGVFLFRLKKGLCNDDKVQMLARQHWLEVWVSHQLETCRNTSTFDSCNVLSCHELMPVLILVQIHPRHHNSHDLTTRLHYESKPSFFYR